MRFFSGFSLKGEAALFEAYLRESDYTVTGFSRGAISALEYCLKTHVRIDRLQLLSPAYFMNRDDAFKASQLAYYHKNRRLYLREFLKNIAYPTKKDLSAYLVAEDEKALYELLYYQWDEKKLGMLKERGIVIEVYLGGKDKIIDAEAAMAFFKPYATCYFIKEGGHILDG